MAHYIHQCDSSAWIDMRGCQKIKTNLPMACGALSCARPDDVWALEMKCMFSFWYKRLASSSSRVHKVRSVLCFIGGDDNDLIYTIYEMSRETRNKASFRCVCKALEMRYITYYAHTADTNSSQVFGYFGHPYSQQTRNIKSVYVCVRCVCATSRKEDATRTHRRWIN